MRKIPIILDCDPGVDDAYAIMLANSHEGFDIRALTPVAGNVEYHHTSRNALDLAEMLGMTCPVARGAERPLIASLRTAGEFHGGNGLANHTLPGAKGTLSDKKAWDVMYEEAKKSGGELQIVAVGPLTNVATAILKYQDLKDHVKRIVIMGGSADSGNHSPYGEFNIWTDPHAAEIVFHSGIPVTMMGLNATRQAALSAQEMKDMGDVETTVQELLQAINRYAFGIQGRKDWESKVILHDAITVGYLMDETLAETKKAYVTCEMTGSLTGGQTVCDFKGITGKPPNVDVVMTVHVEVFRRLLKEMLEFYRKKEDV